jgi:hypothetical protein
MRRRALLSTVGATVAGLAGCLGGSLPSASLPKTNSRTMTTNPLPDGPIRCRGDPVTAERSVTDTPGYGDDVEYFPENETVRFVATRNADGPVSFGTWSFVEWGSIEAAKLGLERVRAVTADRLGTDEFGSGMGQPPDFFPDDEMAVLLNVSTRVEDSETVSTPTVSLSRLADVAPRSVEATVSLDGDEYSRTVPVFAEHVQVGAL